MRFTLEHPFDAFGDNKLDESGQSSLSNQQHRAATASFIKSASGTFSQLWVNGVDSGFFGS